MTRAAAENGVRPHFAVTVRYGLMRAVAEFRAGDATLRRRARCVVSTARGTEIGTVLLAARPVGEGEAIPFEGDVIRRATPEDLERRRRLEDEVAEDELRLARRLQRELGLPMKIVASEHLFGGERVIFHFRAGVRVDIRPLGKALEAELGTRAELRQVSAREEAKLLGDVGHCGQTQCERTFVGLLEPVTMRMALSQRGALDPERLEGTCGLLMYCLRYEDAGYREMKHGREREGIE